jgi:hypothetical protein
MATIKKTSKVKNLSAGPSKKTPIAPKVDPKGQFTKVQERTLGNMKKGGSIKKAQNGMLSNLLNNNKNKTKIKIKIKGKGDSLDNLSGLGSIQPLKKGGKLSKKK